MESVYLALFERNGSLIKDETFNLLLLKLKIKFPREYLQFMKEYNGGEGEIGENSWLCLFPFEELSEINSNYKLLMEQIPNYFLIGKDAADTGYAVHKENQTFHSFGFMSDFKTDTIEFCGNSFIEFLEYLYNYK